MPCLTPRSFFGLMLALALSLNACAQSPNTDPTEAQAQDPCEGHTTVAINACMRQALDAAQQQMQADYHQAQARIKEWTTHAPKQGQEALAELARAQQHWQQFVQADCDAVYTLWQEGTIRTSMALGCRLHHTERRSADLQHLAQPL